MRVFWKKMASTVTRMAAVTAAQISKTWNWMPCHSKLPDGMPMSSGLTVLPQRMSPKPSSTKASPMVLMNRMIGSWLTSGRSTRRSIR